jgi:hypothetical protein
MKDLKKNRHLDITNHVVAFIIKYHGTSLRPIAVSALIPLPQQHQQEPQSEPKFWKGIIFIYDIFTKRAVTRV